MSRKETIEHLKQIDSNCYNRVKVLTEYCSKHNKELSPEKTIRLAGTIVRLLMTAASNRQQLYKVAACPEKPANFKPGGVIGCRKGDHFHDAMEYVIPSIRYMRNPYGK